MPTVMLWPPSHPSILGKAILNAFPTNQVQLLIISPQTDPLAKEKTRLELARPSIITNVYLIIFQGTIIFKQFPSLNKSIHLRISP